MKKIFVSLLLVFAAINANADDVYLSNDTLFCNMTNDEVGTLKAKVSSMTSALDEIHTLVLSGYVSQADEDFIHTLGKDYALANLDMTNLYSSLSSWGLEGCVKLKSVKYSKYWTLTGHCLFEDCSNLSEVVFPDDSECSLTKFSAGTFRGCSSLKSITIPAGIKSMDTQVFYLCNNLLEIHCKSGKAPLANEDTFDEQFSSATIYVPKGAVGNYKTSAGWCLFNNLVEDESSTYTPDEAYSENIAFSGDTLFCNLTNDEVGQLRASVFHIGKDLNSIKNVVLSGYIDSSDGSFLNALASAYNLASLDCTNLHSDFANRQFQGCNKLKTAYFSRYWTSTGWYLFEDCANLENIIFPENHVNGGYSVFDGGTFRGCFSLESIEIPATVKKVDVQCFYLCSNLKKISVKALTPPDATEDSFGNQFSVAQLIVPKGTQLSYKTAAGWTLFQNIVESSDDVEIKEDEISENVHFADGVLYVNLPYNEVGRLKATVLAKLDDLSQIKTAIISDCIDSKDANFLNALASTYSLSTIDFTELKSDFSNFAFQGCEKLESVKYSKYWRRSGWYLFEGCSALTQVEFPQENDLTTFESGTFRECSSLQKIEIPANVTSIGSQCFYLCRNLKEVNFLDTSIKSIDKGAFEGCYSLERIMLPSSMSLVGERCFEGCPNIREIHSESINPPGISENAFNDIYDSAKLYVPVGSREKYATAPVWKNFSSIEEDKTTKLININIETKAFSKSIYTIKGNLIYVGVDADSLKLPAGTYIVKEQNKTKKIIVR